MSTPPIATAGTLNRVLLALAVVCAAVFALRLDARSAPTALLGLQLILLILVLRALRRYRPAHPAMWWGFAVYYVVSLFNSLRSVLAAWSGNPVNFLTGSPVRFVLVLLASAGIVFAAVSFLLVRRRGTATWALADAGVMALGLLTTHLVITTLPLLQELGPSLGFWTEGVLVGGRDMVMIVVALVLVCSERISRLPVGAMVAVFGVWGVVEPAWSRLHAVVENPVLRTAFFATLAGCAVTTAFVVAHPSMRIVALPATDPRPTWTFARTGALLACLAAPIVAVWLEPPATAGGAVVVVVALLLLLTAVVFRMREAVVQGHRLLTEVERLADHDHLTGLPNRRHLYSSYLHGLERRSEEGGGLTLAVSYLDLDNLREVNDRLDHSGGDRLLRAVADALGELRSPEREVVRVGGDEFVVLTIVDPDDDDPVRAAAESEFAVSSALEQLAAQGFDSSGSVGTSWGRLDTGPDSSPPRLLESLMREADLAQSEAKRAGGAQGVMYHPTMSTRSRTRAMLRRSLPGAWAAGQMTLVYQGVRDLRTGESLGAEALLRWDHPELGAVPPPDAIETAIGLGLIGELGLQILRRAQEAVADPGAGPASSSVQVALPWQRLRVGVNVAAPQLRPGAIDALIGAVTGSGLADRVWLEVTEQVLVTERRHVAGALADLRAAGVLVAIDDFGTGYCGLDYLCSLPIDIIKLDKVFARHIADPLRRRVSQTVVQLADSLGAEVIAEGIETLEVADILRDLGCRYGQGYALSMPVPSFDEAVRAGAGRAPRSQTRPEQQSPGPAGG